MSRVLVAGGGIAGLAAALALARHGHHVVVLERGSFGELGAGIQLAPNAFRALDRLGVGARVRDVAVAIDELRLMDARTGAQLVRMPVGEPLRQRFAAPYMVVHRRDLHRALLAACERERRVQLCAGAEVVNIENGRRAVTATLRSGQRLRAAGLVGADGLRSVVRRAVLGDGEPVASRHTAYRSVLPIDSAPRAARCNAAVLWAAPAGHVVHYPIARCAALNVVVTRADGGREGADGAPVAAEEVRTLFANACAPVAELLAVASGWRAWRLFDRDPAPRTAVGRVLLVGDAAHPILQYAAQGACMALEDAACLDSALGGALPAVFAAVARARCARTARVRAVSRAIAEHVYHANGEAARRRDAALAAMTDTELYAEVQWLYGHDAAAAETIKEAA